MLIQKLKKDYFLDKNIEQLLSLNEIANIVNMSADYLRNLINRKKIKGEKINNKWHIKIKDIIEYMDKHK
jgi:excisionase family DNA binding protein